MTDVNAAHRIYSSVREPGSVPWSDAVIAACRAVNREPIGFQAGVDTLAAVVNPRNRFVEALSFAQHARLGRKLR